MAALLDVLGRVVRSMSDFAVFHGVPLYSRGVSGFGWSSFEAVKILSQAERLGVRVLGCDLYRLREDGYPVVEDTVWTRGDDLYVSAADDFVAFLSRCEAFSGRSWVDALLFEVLLQDEDGVLDGCAPLPSVLFGAARERDDVVQVDISVSSPVMDYSVVGVVSVSEWMRLVTAIENFEEVSPLVFLTPDSHLTHSVRLSVQTLPRLDEMLVCMQGERLVDPRLGFAGDVSMLVSASACLTGAGTQLRELLLLQGSPVIISGRWTLPVC